MARTSIVDGSETTAGCSRLSKHFDSVKPKRTRLDEVARVEAVRVRRSGRRMTGATATGRVVEADLVKRALRVRRGEKKAATVANMMKVLDTSGRMGAIELL